MPDTASPLYWKRKLAAYLHDPPEKPYDFGPRHIDRAGIHALSFGVDELWKRMGSNSDWTSAAADRFVFPSGQAIGKNLGEDLRPCFIHPLSGKENQPALPTDALKFPSQAEAAEWLGDIRPDWKSEDPHTLFLRAWRHWSGYAAQHPKGREKGAGLLPYLPADTRIADGSIWHHCAIVSALESTRSSDEPGAPLKPAFLLFQIGPVQDFIAQARSTRDLWSGSYLLSWLTMHAIKAVADHCGPDAILFPSLKGQPLYDFLEQQRLGLEQEFTKAARQEDVLVPGIPNRFLAVVPQDFDAEAIVAAAFKTEWHTIAATCRAWLEKEGIGFDAHHDQLWKNQIASHWQLTWQLWPWQSADAALTAFQQIPLGRENAIHLAKAVAEAIPDAHKDSRCYRDGKLDPGWAWSAHYQLCQHALDARRSLRDFHGLPTDFTRKPGHRDALSGREEAVLQAEAMEEAVKKSTALKHLFRHIEPLGAANLIKRVWHKAYLARLQEVEGKKHLPNLTRARESFDSVPSVAAGAFASRLYQRAEKEGPLREKWLAFLTAASDARDDFPETIANFQDSSEPIWISRTDNSVFVSDLWSKELTRTKVASSTELYHSAEARKRLRNAEVALRSVLEDAGTKPSSYYAVLALDGDQIGKWLSGEKSPNVQDVISRKAADYFRQNIKGQDVEKWLASPRPLSPSWHLQFSEALAHFGLHAARRIVEDVHHGQLIYSGGDDVLAMLPADEAIACALDLRAAFQGRHAAMSVGCQALFRPEAPEGFLWLAQPKPGEPTWPLLVPGPRMTVSVGIAIGHVREPLQDMISEAQKAEKRAKAAPEKEIYDRSHPDPAKHGLKWKRQEGWDRDALAVTLFKRSGETIQWGAKLGSASFDLLRTFQEHYRTPWDRPNAEMPISGKFPYRVAELLEKFGPKAATTAELADIALAEFTWATQQQIRKIGKIQSDAALDQLRQALREKAAAYVHELRDFAWTRPDEQAPTTASRPLSEFTHLFLLEAFIRRQAT